ncbi:sensor histidine kinase [Paenibacillus methanolicus]|uniref:histidine kinase n=1 Tax=Paenibacillus methanolicus TaxID=582686 RepID=A0A5S5C201_9BACL|nr:HAMP domain-containing sensor histidine kinase [Paenibacillus methanolicus]TYP72492.1 histidine kinase/DNA gyrase B/HSP90-like ATPase [Paenibacillus methanolicus]
MLYYTAALLAAAAILLVRNPRHPVSQTAALFLISASLGGLGDVLTDTSFQRLARVVQVANLAFTPYAVLLFASVYGNWKSLRLPVRPARWLLLVPVVVTFVAESWYNPNVIRYGWLLVWAGPYYAAACALLLDAFRRAESPQLKRSRFILVLIMVPTLLAVLIFIYGARAIWPEFAFMRYISVFFVYSFGVALLGTFLYGVLGVKLTFERDPLDTAMKSVTSGTAMLNHALKNELGKIAISADNLRAELPLGQEAASGTDDHLRIIENASAHMMAMVSRIHAQTREIVLREQPCSLAKLVQACVDGHAGMLASQGIAVHTDYRIRPIMACDDVHVKEALGNLIRNAIEAMPAGGAITIRLDADKKYVRIAVTDTGPGISREALVRAFEPFYSTKSRHDNYGLGLSYVYNVMARSGGRIELAGEPGRGTTAMLLLPLGKMIEGEEEGAMRP